MEVTAWQRMAIISSSALVVVFCAMAFAGTSQNPVIDFDEILFNTFRGEGIVQGAHIPCGGVTDKGNGIYVVSGIKSGAAKARDLLESSVVINGKYRGEILSNKNPRWAGRAQFHSPALSFDGKRVVFAWAESNYQDAFKAEKLKIGDHARTSKTVFHVYSMNMDGTDLRQLTDHEWANDYHPCWLPNGRIVFLSERGALFDESRRQRPVSHQLARDQRDLPVGRQRRADRIHAMGLC